MPTKLRGGSAKSTATAKKKKDADTTGEADSSKENNQVVVAEKVVVDESAVAALPDEKSSKKRQTSKSSRVVAVKQEDHEVAAKPELAEISCNNKATAAKKMTKCKSKLLASAVNGTVVEPLPDQEEETVDTAAVSVSTTTIETVDSKRTFVSKATKKSTSKSTLRKMASGSVGGSSGSCSESGSSASSSSSSSSSNDQGNADSKDQAVAKKAKKKLKSNLNTSSTDRSFSDSFTKFFVNKKITDYFQVRKSTRKCKSDLEKEKRQLIEDAILNAKEEGLEVRNVDQKGRGIFATRAFKRGDFVCEYAGEMISYAEAKEREERYAKDESVGCYMYFFMHKTKSYCIDATAESKRLGRLLNHSKLDGNCQTKLFEIDSHPYLILVAARDIDSGEELTYDYGDRNKMAIESHPWLAQ